MKMLVVPVSLQKIYHLYPFCDLGLLVIMDRNLGHISTIFEGTLELQFFVLCFSICYKFQLDICGCISTMHDCKAFFRLIVVEDIALCYIIKYTIYVVTVKHNYLLCL